MMALRRAWTPRGGDVARVALMWPAAFAVHQLRYMLAYGHGASAELQRSGHSYLHSVVPWLIGLVALAAGCFVRAVGRALARQTTAARFGLSFLGLWVVCSAVLVAIFAGQEILEGLFALGHPTGLAGVFGYGGWWALPAATCLGLILAAVFHGARWVVARVAARGRRGRLATPAPVVIPIALAGYFPVATPLLDGRSSRGPPRTPRRRVLAPRR